SRLRKGGFEETLTVASPARCTYQSQIRPQEVIILTASAIAEGEPRRGLRKLRNILCEASITVHSSFPLCKARPASPRSSSPCSHCQPAHRGDTRCPSAAAIRAM